MNQTSLKVTEAQKGMCVNISCMQLANLHLGSDCIRMAFGVLKLMIGVTLLFDSPTKYRIYFASSFPVGSVQTPPDL